MQNTLDLGVTPGVVIKRVTELRKSLSHPTTSEFRSEVPFDIKITNTRLPNKLKYRNMFQGTPQAIQQGFYQITDLPH